MLKRLSPAVLFIAVLGGCGLENERAAPLQHYGTHLPSIAGAMTALPGDTVWKIAERYRLPLRDIIDINDLNVPYALREGQRIVLPPPMEHRVGAQDTLYRLSKMYDVPLSQMVRLNNLQAPYALKVGQVLRIPSTPKRVAEEKRERAVQARKVEASALRQQQTRPGSLQKTEDKRTAAAPAAAKPKPVQTTIADPRRAGFVWPVRGTVVSSYGAKAGGLFNDGINIAAPRGTPVMAAADGAVVYAGSGLRTYGNLILIRHGDGLVTAYSHLASMSVKKGDAIRRGQSIGAVGSTGSVANSQLHFEIRRGTETLDPLTYL